MRKRAVHGVALLGIFLLFTGLILPAAADAQTRELINNAKLQGLQGWTIQEWFKPSSGKGEVIPERDGVKFRSTSGNNRVGIMQALNVDVSKARSLVLRAVVKATGQKLDGTGWQGREAPIAVFVAYTDMNGVVHNGLPSMANPSEPQGNRMLWEGFYYANPTGNSRNWHGTKVPQNQFYTYQYDLMALNPKPKTIHFVGAEGAGWSPREGKIALLSLTLVGGTPPPPPPGPVNLTGPWKGNDGGKYYIRQLGNNVWWFGEQSPTNPGWSNVARGVLNGNELRLEWADVPKGRIMGSGNLVLKVESPSRIVATSKTGGFGGSIWTR